MTGDTRERYERLRTVAPTYPEVGATRAVALGEPGAALPGGYHSLRREIRLGSDETTYATARDTLLGWGMQRGTGASVHPATPPEPAATVLISYGVGPLRAVIPCRVVWTVDEPGRVGFAYGTLPGHPECGEEAFLVRRDDAGQVWGTVLAFSRAAAWYTRLGGPVARAAQRFMAGRYLAALRSAGDRAR
jgi:uncharacterized protein (UPF0548 family)